MQASTETNRISEIARGLRIKRTNAATALLTGAAIAALAAWMHPETLTPVRLMVGLLTGVFYANGFEYLLHRFVLHWGEGFLVQRHALHHNSAGSDIEARYVNFATSPIVVVLVFVLNAPLPFALEYFARPGLDTGIILGFAAYYIAYEEIHWRIHFGGRLPVFMRGVRRHHMLHHRGSKGRYNVFLPIFDWIFERHKWNRPVSG